ncbi:HK97 family phage prohead protease [Porphyrobacter algicida]|uniref:HK97 family phage prohead protease n=1 Tax=Qipengyuania algicida TaxID=1836209 RepID=A0A845AEK6_9SPHN|nr:HK97 family phage prohead protease [Qipengyuania algicida]MXP28104.1 HK97 family phage prohead protease [Qipengyuania algicida]
MSAAATIERRFTTELRALGRKLEGYAATFNAEADLGAFRERIAPGAFRAALAGDILALLDHDAGKVLGRTRTGTLELREDGHGLAFAIQLPDTQSGRDVIALAERGDLGGMSFGFTVPEGGEAWQGETRTLTAIDLREISVVSAWPAYGGTEVALRARAGTIAVHRRARALRLAEARQWA